MVWWCVSEWKTTARFHFSYSSPGSIGKKLEDFDLQCAYLHIIAHPTALTTVGDCFHSLRQAGNELHGKQWHRPWLQEPTQNNFMWYRGKVWLPRFTEKLKNTWFPRSLVTTEYELELRFSLWFCFPLNIFTCLLSHYCTWRHGILLV